MSFSFFIYYVTNPLQYPPLTSRDLVHSNKRLLSHGFCYHDVTLDDFFLLESGARLVIIVAVYISGAGRRRYVMNFKTRCRDKRQLGVPAKHFAQDHHDV